VVGGRSVNRVDVLRDRAEAKITEAGTTFRIDEYVLLEKVVCQSGEWQDKPNVHPSDLRGRHRCYAGSQARR